VSDLGALTLRRFDRLDLAMWTAVVVGVVTTLALLAIPAFHGHVVAPALDLALDTTAFIVTALVSALSWVRYREGRQATALVQSAAFLALAIADGIAVGIAVVGDLALSPSTVASAEAQLYIWAGARLLAPGLLVAGGIQSLRGRQSRHPMAIMAGTVAVMLVVVGSVAVAGDRLTSLLAYPMSAPGMPEAQDLAHTTAGAAMQVVSGGLFLAAALVVRRLWRRDRSIADAYLAFGLVIAAFAELLCVFYPSVHPEQMATADLLRLVFYVVLLLGIRAGARAALEALQAANVSLERLRDVEVERAALEERARLSRELHDGLAQDLWLAKLKVGRLAASPTLSPEDRTLAEEATKAVEVGLAEARQGVIALRESAAPSKSFEDLLERYADDIADRFGMPVEFDCDGRLPELPSRTKADLLRIVQEALSNAARHADAETIRLSVGTQDGLVSLTVEDDGRGFDPGDVPSGHVGLQVMRERAEMIGGHMTVVSSVGGGTRVIVTVPARADGAVGGAG
jgi:signal transduction histidine kinase